jgi:hypothetical protein
MSKLSADSLSSRSGGSISVVNDVNITGIITATTFSGTVPSSNLSGALPALDGSALTNLNIPSSSDWRDSSLF